MILRQLSEADVEFTIRCDPEDLPYVGFCSRVNAVIDKQTELWIHQQLERGNEWAWCFVTVMATWQSIVGHSCLGGCSYRSEEEFCRPGGYYQELQTDAITDLNREIERLKLLLTQLEAK